MRREVKGIEEKCRENGVVGGSESKSCPIDINDGIHKESLAPLNEKKEEDNEHSITPKRRNRRGLKRERGEV